MTSRQPPLPGLGAVLRHGRVRRGDEPPAGPALPMADRRPLALPRPCVVFFGATTAAAPASKTNSSTSPCSPTAPNAPTPPPNSPRRSTGRTTRKRRSYWGSRMAAPGRLFVRFASFCRIQTAGGGHPNTEATTGSTLFLLECGAPTITVGVAIFPLHFEGRVRSVCVANMACSTVDSRPLGRSNSWFRSPFLARGLNSVFRTVSFLRGLGAASFHRRQAPCPSKFAARAATKC